MVDAPKEKMDDFHKACKVYKGGMALFLADLEVAHLGKSVIEPKIASIEEKNADNTVRKAT